MRRTEKTRPFSDSVSSRVSRALRKAASKKFSAFTLAELIVVITILAILATIGFLALSGYTQDARDASAKANVRSVYSAIAAESALTGNSPRFYVVHDSTAALAPGTVAFVDGTGVTLTGGAWNDSASNYSAGNPEWTKLKLNPEKFRLSDGGLPGGTAALAARVAGFGTADAAYDSDLVTVWAVDAPLAPTASGKKRQVSFFQVAATVPDTGAVTVSGNFPVPTSAEISSGAAVGLVKGSGTGALVDGVNSGGTAGGDGDAPVVTNSCSASRPACAGASCELTLSPGSPDQSWTKDSSSCGFACTGGYSGNDCLTAPAPAFVCGTSTVGTNAYATIMWPDGKCWTKENMRHAPSVWNRYCYNNNEANCATYGALYDWAAATSDLCSQLWAGWALPTDAQWDALGNAWATGWTGNKLSGIVSSLPGYRSTGGSFLSQGTYGYWWSSTQYDASYAWYRYLNSGNAAVDANYRDKAVGFSVVCLKN